MTGSDIVRHRDMYQKRFVGPRFANCSSDLELPVLPAAVHCDTPND
jgi:hypothetical protein